MPGVAEIQRREGMSKLTKEQGSARKDEKRHDEQQRERETERERGWWKM